MLYAILAALVAASPMTVAQAGCSGADPALVSVAVKGVTPSGNLNNYQIDGTVTNQGAAQSADVLQSVDIYAAKATDKLDAKSIPPLKAGESYTFSYTSVRSKDAGNGTTTLRFVLDVHNGNGADCNSSNDEQTLTF